MNIAVVYLAYGVGGGLAAAETFFRSYRSHPAGAPHDLVVIAKGWEDESGFKTLREMAGECEAEVMDLPDDGFDWGAYMRAAERLSQDWVVFLNTQSEIRKEGWLRIMSKAATNQGVGAVGCTGSWGTRAVVMKFILPILMEKRRNKGTLKFMFASADSMVLAPLRWVKRFPWFPQFPNPHLRSNAFLTRRKLFAEYARNHRIPRTKNDAYRFEHGRVSFTRFLSARGLKSVIVGKDGKSYGPDEWMDSSTFRVPGQENLLISDNQTRDYDTLLRAGRRISEYSAWGRFLTP
ncbi:MAG: hypothetical protein IID17_12785 [Nitrospinae bacterium]|nr:hypothetical protein [Nitrospinota bacterium]